MSTAISALRSVGIWPANRDHHFAPTPNTLGADFIHLVQAELQDSWSKSTVCTKTKGMWKYISDSSR